MLPALYGYLVVVGTVALALVVAAQLRAATAQTAGRLLATLFTLAGLIVAAIGRVTDNFELVAVGLVAVNIGVTLYCLYVPDVKPWHRSLRRRDLGGDR